MKIQAGDIVKVIAGKDKGKTGKVLRVYKDKDKVLVEGINMVKKHVKPGVLDTEGGIVHIEKPVPASNVMYYDEKNDAVIRIGYKIVEGKKYRISKKSGDILEE